jgi:hypothetical protein
VKSLAQRILAVLGESAVPVSTPALVVLCACELSNARSRVWSELRELLAAGLVARAGKSLSRGDRRARDYAVTTWRLT